MHESCGMILIELIILGSDCQTCLLQSLPDFMEKGKVGGMYTGMGCTQYGPAATHHIL